MPELNQFLSPDEPTGEEVIAYLAACARSVRPLGWNTEQAADFLLHAAYDLHAEAQGAPDLPGWQDRANRRFQFAVGFFSVGIPRAPTTPNGTAVLLPMVNVPPPGPRNRSGGCYQGVAGLTLVEAAPDGA